MMKDMLLSSKDMYDKSFDDLIDYVTQCKKDNSGFIESIEEARSNLLYIGEAFDAIASLAGTAVTPAKLAAIIEGAKLFVKAADGAMRAASDSYDFYSTTYADIASSIGVSLVSMRVPDRKGGNNESKPNDNA